MKLLMFYPFLIQKGGADRILLHIAKRFNPVIYTSYYKKGFTFKELEDFEINVFTNRAIEAAFSLVKDDVKRNIITSGVKSFFHKVKEDYDVICALLPCHWIRNRNERVVWYFFGPLRSAFDLYSLKVQNLPLHKKIFIDTALSFYKGIDKIVDPKIEKVVSGSPYVNVRDADFIKKYIGRPIDATIPLGLDEKKFTNSGYEKYFFYPSRISPEKRFEYVIEAFKIFSKKMKGWKLIIAGFLLQRERELRYAEYLKEISRGFNIEFRFNPEDDELRDLYSRCHAVLFSAINEDFGLIPLEAMASEKPCISVNEGGPAYTIKDTKTGFLVNSQQEMADRMLYLAEHPDENERIGKAGRKEVIKNYTWKVFLDRMEKEFKKVAKTKEV